MMEKIFAATGAFNMALCVVLGAFAAHGLKSRLSEGLMQTFHTGVQYHFYHSLGLLVVALLAARLGESSLLRWSGFLMIFGIVTFSGSLYALALSAAKGIGMVTPIGGIAFIVAWLLVGLATLKSL